MVRQPTEDTTLRLPRTDDPSIVETVHVKKGTPIVLDSVGLCKSSKLVKSFHIPDCSYFPSIQLITRTSFPTRRTSIRSAGSRPPNLQMAPLRHSNLKLRRLLCKARPARWMALWASHLVRALVWGTNLQRSKPSRSSRTFCVHGASSRSCNLARAGRHGDRGL